MGIFHEVLLSWDGKEYAVPHDKVMGLIEVVEDIVTFQDLVATSGIKFAKISKAYYEALVYAGVKNATHEAVYSLMMGGSSDGVNVQVAVNSLLMMMIPPEHLQESKPPKAATPRKPKRRKPKS